MTCTITQISNPWSLPKLNVSVQPTIRYEWTQGYGGQKLLGNDLSGNGYNANMFGFTSNDYYPLENSGLIKLNNSTCNGTYYITTPLNPSVNEYSFFMGFRLDAIQNSGCFNAEIFTGAYAFSTHDWWCGIQGTTIIFSRNGNLISTGITAVVGRYYIIGLGNIFVQGTGAFGLWDSAGNSYTSSTIGAYAASTAGIIGIGKYGGFANTYMPRITLGHYHFWSGTGLSLTEITNLKNQYRMKYRITI